MAVRSCVEGGAGAPGGHRITGDPTRGCRGGAGRGLRLGAAGAGHDRVRAWRRGTWAALIAPRVRPVPAHRVGRDPPRGRRGAGSTAGRRRRPRPGRPWPAPRSASWTPTRPCASGSSTRPGDRGRSQGGSPPACGSRTPMMGACASVTSRSTQGPDASRAPAACAPSCGWRGPCAPDAPAAHPRSPLAGEARAQGQELDPGRHPPVCARPRGDEGAVPGHWEADPIIAGRPPAAP